MIHRRALPNHRHHTTQEVRIAGLRTLYLSVHDDSNTRRLRKKYDWGIY